MTSGGRFNQESCWLSNDGGWLEVWVVCFGNDRCGR